MKNAVLLTLAGVFIISLITLGIAYAMPTAAQDLVTPDLVFDVYVRTLPETDQEQLQRGIWVASYDKLTELVEDYIS